ncbi:fatty acid cis/trans isomerase [Teredinibacter turnerae]|uniref:fatty acid cis/trans isomerase n=1 Tax=Teredinibacter turnerae TaxID=2426 RepID=UPI00035EC958|nr:fatty acid cis/trans isomerase [Teredinibacter turnerae]
MTFKPSRLLIVSAILLLGACAVYTTNNLVDRYGNASAKDREVIAIDESQVDYWRDVKPVLDNRCVVCHACYDAPCQLKFTAPEGLARGASKDKVYHPQRLTAAPPSRLFQDAFGVEAWRERGFFPVLNEFKPSTEANREASVMYRMLQLKADHPVMLDTPLTKDIPVGINRDEFCPQAENFDAFANEHPQWGMPYGLPGLSNKEFTTLTQWLQEGGRYTPLSPLDTELEAQRDEWEAFFNRTGNKGRLVSRYLYEHLFLAHLYFSEQDQTIFFKLVRSHTPPGQPVKLLSTRRPIDDPGTQDFYYRLVREQETIVAKTHMPYALNTERMQFWQGLFFNTNYTVGTLPGYGKKHIENPFLTFAQLPVKSRYKFLLKEAQFSIMNFIKGPVCRGQAALNVIKDHFWVFFVDPEVISEAKVAEFLQENADYYDLPNADSDVYLPLSTWLHYSHKQKKLLNAREAFLKEQLVDENRSITLDLIWDGEGNNKNAALTIFRHFDSATVEQGLVGAPPQTAWVIGYSLLERIHYLLVASYDVYGNVGHQLMSRLYMDFLRMDGESTFLLMLPSETRAQERQNWYREASPEVLDYLKHPALDNRVEPDIDYRSSTPKVELFSLLEERLGDAVNRRRDLDKIDNKVVRKALQRLAKIKGKTTEALPENTYLYIHDGEQHFAASLLRNNAHLNITSMFREDKYLVPEENDVTVTNGFTGAYPIALFDLDVEQLAEFVDAVGALKSKDDYTKLVNQYGVRRTNANFWPELDKIHAALREFDPVEFGVLDLNRLQNR